MADGVLKVPVRINGGGSNPTSLKERELYVKTDTGVLYYGKSGNKVGNVGITGSDANLYSFNGSTAKFGGLSASKEGSVYKLDPTPTVNPYNVIINGVKLGALVLDNANYGSNLPTNPVEGQVYFYVPDDQ